MVTDAQQSQTEAKGDLFEMRRLESLSNTIFGVAMTLLAYDAPKAGHFAGPPDWSDLYHAYAGRLSGLVLSFIIAGMFWFSHHRRLARQPYGSPWVVILNLLFLLSIILLPVTNGLYGNFGMHGAVAVVYGLHLTAIAGLNALLWWLATRGSIHFELAGALFPLLAIVLGTIVALFAPQDAQYLWYLAFGGFAVRHIFRGRGVHGYNDVDFDSSTVVVTTRARTINLRGCPVHPDTDRICATAANVAMGQKATSVGQRTGPEKDTREKEIRRGIILARYQWVPRGKGVAN